MATPNIMAGLYDAFAYETIAITNAGATALTSATFMTATGTAKRAVITIEDAAVRYRIDGGTPVTTTGAGHVLNANDVVTVTGRDNLSAFKAIAVSAAASIRVTYEK